MTNGGAFKAGSLPALRLGAGLLLVVLGLFRRFAPPLQALTLAPRALMIWRYLLDPMGAGRIRREDSQILFFPAVEDRWSIDVSLGRRGPAQ